MTRTTDNQDRFAGWVNVTNEYLVPSLAQSCCELRLEGDHASNPAELRHKAYSWFLVHHDRLSVRRVIPALADPNTPGGYARPNFTGPG